jgi:hypothetical protein
VSRSSSTREPVAQPPRSTSSPVLHPLPLPSLRPSDLEAQVPPARITDGWSMHLGVSIRFLHSFFLLLFLSSFIRIDWWLLLRYFYLWVIVTIYQKLSLHQRIDLQLDRLLLLVACEDWICMISVQFDSENSFLEITRVILLLLSLTCIRIRNSYE